MIATRQPTSPRAPRTEEPAEERDELSTEPSPSGSGRFWFVFDRWLSVTPQAEEEFVFA